MQDTLDDVPRVLLDPNTLSADGTAALTAIEPSADGALLAYAHLAPGSDRQDIRIRDVETGSESARLPALGEIRQPRAGPSRRDGLFYLRFPEPGTVPPEDEQYFGRIYFHRLGDAQAADVLVFDRPTRRTLCRWSMLRHDGRFLVVTAQRGASDDSEIYLIDLSRPETSAGRSPVFTGFDAAYAFIDETDARLFFRTTRDAPYGRIIAVDAEHPAAPFEEIVAMSSDRLSAAVLAHDTIVAAYLHNASDRLALFDRTGRPAEKSVCQASDR